MKLLKDDFLVVENQFGKLNTAAQIVGYLNDPEYTPREIRTPKALIATLIGIGALLANILDKHKQTGESVSGEMLFRNAIPFVSYLTSRDTSKSQHNPLAGLKIAIQTPPRKLRRPFKYSRR
jgi:hypothetical protein